MNTPVMEMVASNELFVLFLTSFLDSLLCHDDELDDRRVAFVLYLSENWEAKDGGTLDLIMTDGQLPAHAYVIHLIE